MHVCPEGKWLEQHNLCIRWLHAVLCDGLFFSLESSTIFFFFIIFLSWLTMWCISMPPLCSTGHYCVNGTRVSTEHPCPAGTFNNGTGLAADTDCFACLGILHVCVLAFVRQCLYTGHWFSLLKCFFLKSRANTFFLVTVSERSIIALWKQYGKWT